MSINVQFILKMSNLTPNGDLIEDLKGQLTSCSSTSNWGLAYLQYFFNWTCLYFKGNAKYTMTSGSEF